MADRVDVVVHYIDHRTGTQLWRTMQTISGMNHQDRMNDLHSELNDHRWIEPRYEVIMYEPADADMTVKWKENFWTHSEYA